MLVIQLRIFGIFDVLIDTGNSFSDHAICWLVVPCITTPLRHSLDEVGLTFGQTVCNDDPDHFSIELIPIVISWTATSATWGRLFIRNNPFDGHLKCSFLSRKKVSQGPKALCYWFQVPIVVGRSRIICLV